VLWGALDSGETATCTVAAQRMGVVSTDGGVSADGGASVDDGGGDAGARD
jgi:hypothetical protein